MNGEIYQPEQNLFRIGCGIKDDDSKINLINHKEESNKKINKSLLHLNKILNAKEEANKKLFLNTVNKFDISNKKLKIANNSGAYQGFSFEKFSTVDISEGKILLEHGYEKMEQILHLPKQRYLKNLSKQLTLTAQSQQNQNLKLNK